MWQNTTYSSTHTVTHTITHTHTHTQTHTQFNYTTVHIIFHWLEANKMDNLINLGGLKTFQVISELKIMTVHYYCKLVRMPFRKSKRIGCYITDMTYFACTFLDMVFHFTPLNSTPALHPTPAFYSTRSNALHSTRKALSSTHSTALRLKGLSLTYSSE